MPHHCCLLLQLEVAMEIIGERSIRIEELEADIVDMKAIFHSQLEEAVGQVHALKQQLAGGSEELQQTPSDAAAGL
jgi:flagellar motor switch protein FliG